MKFREPLTLTENLGEVMNKAITLLFPRSEFLLNETTFPPLGILYLASVLKIQDYEVQCLDFGLGHTIDDIQHQIVGISFTTPQRLQVYDIVKTLKQKGKFLIAGGAHPTHMPIECIENGFDIVVRGEADYHLPIILKEHFNRLSKPQIYSPCEPKKIDVIPFPDRNALPIKDYHYAIDDRPSTVVMTSRGCYANCSFCAKVTCRFRVQSAQRTVDELFHIRDKYGFTAFMIFDDVFAVHKKRLYEIADLMRNEDFKFRCFGRADSLADESICETLARMGVVEVGIGVESGSDVVLSQNFKNTTSELNSIAVTNLKKQGIRVKCFIIVGLPGESVETIEDTRNWLKRNKPDDVDISIFQPMPGSPIFKDPSRYDVVFTYDHNPMWYKGVPEKYTTSVTRSGKLLAREIIYYRNQLESEFKKKELLR